jgi:hypothetical protein
MTKNEIITITPAWINHRLVGSFNFLALREEKAVTHSFHLDALQIIGRICLSFGGEARMLNCSHSNEIIARGYPIPSLDGC